MRSFIVLALSVLITGCQTFEQIPVGSGQITLSETVTKKYQEEYLNRGPEVFVVSEDGRRYGYSYCPTGATGMCNGGTAEFDAQRNCQANSNAKCFIFDRGGYVVWEGPVTFSEPSSNEGHSIIPSLSTSSGSTDKTLCQYVTQVISTERSWIKRSDAGNVNARNEARRRGLSLSDCDLLLAKPPIKTDTTPLTIKERLSNLKSLLDEGLITEEDASKKRAELLKGL